MFKVKGRSVMLRARARSMLIFVIALVGFVFLLAHEGLSYAESSDCDATLSSDLKLNVPVVSFEGNYYQVDFQYSPSSDGLIWLIDNVQDIVDKNNTHDIVDS